MFGVNPKTRQELRLRNFWVVFSILKFYAYNVPGIKEVSAKLKFE